MHVRTTIRALIVAGLALCASVHASAQQQPPVEAMRAVRFDARTLAGDSVHVGAGAPATLVVVFATWCRSCRDEVATVNALGTEFAARVRVLAVNVDRDDQSAVAKWLTAARATYAAAIDTGSVIARALGVVGVPEIYLISGEGRAVFVRRGPVGASLPALRAAIMAIKPVSG